MLRAPPPIPKLRTGLVITREPNGVHIFDPGLGRHQRFQGLPWSRLLEILEARTISPRDVSGLIKVPLVQGHQMVRTLLERHLLATPRAFEQVVVRRSYLTFKGKRARKRRPRLTSFEWASAHTVGLARRLRLIDASTLGLQLAAFEKFDAFLSARHEELAVDEVFASRDAFQLVRPDPISAHARLRDQVGQVVRAAAALPASLADVVVALFTGGFQQLDRDAPSPWVRRRGLRGPGSLVDAAGFAFLTTAIALHVGDSPGPDALAALRRWYRAHAALLTELCFAQAAVLTGLSAPRACPPWSTGY